MMPNKNTKYAASTKEGQERPLPVTSTAIEEIPVAIVSMAPNGFVGTIENPNAMRVHVAKSTAHHEDSKPLPVTDLTLFKDDSTRWTSKGDNGTSKRKVRSTHTRTDSEPSTKRPKNKQSPPAISDVFEQAEDDPSNDKDRKPAAKDTTTPTPDGVPSSTCCAGFKRKNTSTRTSTYTGSVVSTSGQGRIKLEPPIIKSETTPAPTGTNLSIDQAEAPIIPKEQPAMMNGPNLNHRTVTVRRKAANRTDPLYLPPPPSPLQNIAAPLSLSAPPAEEIPAMKKPRVEDESLPSRTDEATRKTTSPDISEGFPSPERTPRPITATVHESTRCRSRHQSKLSFIETSEAQLDDDDGDGDGDYVDDDDDLSGPALDTTATATVRTSILRPSSRRLISISTIGTPILPKRQCQTELPSIETSEAQLDDDDRDDDVDGDLSGPSSWDDRLSELADYRKIHGHCNNPISYSGNSKLARWVETQRRQYTLHLHGKTSPMTPFRIQELPLGQTV
jgi:hypothetical protein